MMTINEALDLYSEIQAQEEELKSKKNELRDYIVDMMNSNCEVKHINDNNVEASIVEKVNFKYTDELSMINYLENNGLNQFVEKKIITTALNKELKKAIPLTESLSPMFEKQISQSLTVKKIV